MSKSRIIAEIATDSLQAISKVAQVAISKKNEGHKVNLEQFSDVNAWTTPELGQNIGEINRDNQSNLSSIAEEPLIGRVEIFDYTVDSKRVIYISRHAAPLVPDYKIASRNAPWGRIFSRKLGETHSLIVSGKEECEFDVENRIELHPVKENGEWDSIDNNIAIADIGNSTVESLRKILPPPITEADETESQELDSVWEQNNIGNISVGHKKPLIQKTSLRDQLYLDDFQDEIFGMPIDSQCFLSGPPGTGKTTTLIRRLSLKSNLIEMKNYEDELKLIENLKQEFNKPHESSWIMFSPTELLRQYVKEAFSRERVAAPDENIQTWDTFRHKIARDKLSILRTGTGSGQFVEKDEEIIEEPSLIDQTKWYDDFHHYIDNQNNTELMEVVNDLKKNENSKIKNLCKSLPKIIEQMKFGTYTSGLKSLSNLFPKLKEIDKDLSESIDRLLIEITNQITHFDKSFPQKLMDQLVKQNMSFKNSDERSDEDAELDDSDDEIDTDSGPALDLKKSLRLFHRTLKALARATVAGRTVPKKSQNGLLIAWLGKDRLPSDEDLIAMGEILVVQRKIRKFIRIVPFYMNSIAKSYRKFRELREKEGKWYQSVPIKSNEVTLPEIDLLILVTLRMAQEMLNHYRQNADSDIPRGPILNAVKSTLVAQVLVDEATDFSVIQLACMYELTHPSMRSFFMCGDLNQRLTEWGIRSESELKWIDSRIVTEKIKISYRQSGRLIELAKSLAEIGGNSAAVIDRPDRIETEEYKPVWKTNLNDLEKIADWLSLRINEINSIVKKTTTIGVLVNDESQVEDLTRELNKRLGDISLKAVACVKGNIMGDDKDVRVFDIQHIKGLEFESVFYISLDETIINHPQLFSKYLYVGATRAATFLGITFKGNIPSEIQTLKSHFGEEWFAPA